jgi:hypothetical protein
MSVSDQVLVQNQHKMGVLAEQVFSVCVCTYVCMHVCMCAYIPLLHIAFSGKCTRHRLRLRIHTLCIHIFQLQMHNEKALTMHTYIHKHFSAANAQ